MNVGQWTDGDSWFVTQGTTGGLRSWHWAQGRDRRESPSLWLQKAVPDWSLPLCQGGGQAWAHRPLWYLLATWQALNMSCYCSVPPSQFVNGNSVTRPGKEALRPFKCCFSLHSSLAHPAPHLLNRITTDKADWSETKQFQEKLEIKNWLVLVTFSPPFFSRQFTRQRMYIMIMCEWMDRSGVSCWMVHVAHLAS